MSLTSTAADIPVTQGANTSTYVYNGLGDRLSQTVNSVTTNYTLDTSTSLSAGLNAGLTQVLVDSTNTYLYGLGRIGEQQPIGFTYHLGDSLGSVRQVTDASANVTLARSYEPFGSTLVSMGIGNSVFQYTGQMRDASGLTFLRSRYLSNDTGRFVTRDRWPGNDQQPLSLNKWNYVEGNPINFVDPTGRCLSTDYECRDVKDEIERHFNYQVRIDPISIIEAECIPPILGQSIPWTTAELDHIREGLYLLEQFWTPRTFEALFTPVTIRRVHLSSGGGADTKYVDPLGMTTSPVIELNDATFNDITREQIGVLWGELYHVMDYYMSVGPSKEDFESGLANFVSGCILRMRYSFAFAYAVGWSFDQCFQAVRGLGPEIESPANILVTNYAGKGPHEDFAHTYQVITEALIAGDELCSNLTTYPVIFSGPRCIKSGITSSLISTRLGFWVDSARLQFFIDDAIRFGANVSVEFQIFGGQNVVN